MKTIVFLFVMLFVSGLYAQTYNMSTTSVATCSGTFYDSGGSAGNYSSSQSFTMTFSSDNENRISFNFQSFSTESGFDKLYIYDGPSTSYPLIGTYSGTTSPGIVTSTDTCLTFYFYSDGSNTSSGWSANISCTTPPLTAYSMSSGTVSACEGVFYDNGGPAANYPNSENREMTFCSDNSGLIQFTFSSFAVSNEDTLYAYDGPSSASPLIGKYTGTQIPEIVSSKTGGCITFKFVSTAATNNTGWKATFTCSASAPTEIFNMQDGVRYTCGGTFYDNGGTSNYSASFYKTMTFYSDNGNRISFNFQSFSTESGFDKLYIYDGPTTAYPLIGTYSGSTSPGIVTSTGTSLTFYFSSDGSNTYAGWSAYISCATPPLTSYVMSSGTVSDCEGVFYDNGGPAANYPNSENREMTFCSDNSEYIQFTFYQFAISNEDTLYAYDGPSSASPLIGKYTGTQIPETISSKTGSCVTFKFVSTSATNNTGWKAIFSCSPGVPTPVFNMQDGVRYTCGGTFYDNGGTSNYSASFYKTMTFYSDNGNRLSFDFQSFSTESGFDKLYVYDGPSTSYPLLGTYSGSSGPGVVTSTGTSMTFYFSSDGSNTYTGWAANISCITPPLDYYPMSSGTVSACEGVFFDNGGPAANYPQNENRVMTFCSDSGNYIKFTFTHFDIYSDDTLYVYDGNDISAPLIGIYSGNILPEVFSSKTGSCVTFKFVSNSSNNGAGWRALISCADTPVSPSFIMSDGVRYTCGGMFYDNGGASGYYSASYYKTMTFYSDNGNRLSFDFQTFSTESGFDKLYVYDGPSTSYPLLGTYTGNSGPGVVTSTGTSLTFYFYSDGSNTYSGWAAGISCTTPPLDYYPMSSGTVSACEGVFFDNGGPSANYPQNENRVMTFCSDSGNYIQFTFTHFDVYVDDSLYVYDGNDVNAPLIGIYTGNVLPEVISSKTGSCVTFKFVSNASNAATGWRAMISCTDAPSAPSFVMSDGVRYTCGGMFYDNGGPSANYSASFSKTMTFYSDNGNRLSFDFQSFTTESGYDKLYVYDGPTTSYPVIGIYYSGSTGPGVVTSTGTALTFYFSSDGSNTYAGWSASISCTTPALDYYNMTSGTINTCSGVFFDNGGPAASYPNNENRVMTFCSDSGNFIQFTFVSGNFSISNEDSLYVYDGPSASGYPIAIFTGYTSPGQINSITGSCLTFKFISTVSTNTTGWKALISCVDTINPIPQISMNSGAWYTCEGKFYDSGGSANNYSNSEAKILTIHSNSGCPVSVTFTGFATQTTYDKLYIYDGPTTASPLIGTYSGFSLPPSATSTGSCLTFYYYSDGSTTNMGWTADISCEKAGITASPSLNACIGDTVMLTATAGTSYLWSNGQTTQTIDITSGGIYSVTVTNSNGCNLVSDPKVVTFNAVPGTALTAGGATTFCQGNSVQLTASTGTSYHWNNNATSSYLNVYSSGDYWVTVTNSAGCFSVSDTIQVTVLPLPANTITVNGNTTFCQGESATLTADEGNSWLWTTTETTQSVVVNQTGNYYATITGSNGCSIESQHINITVYPKPDSVITVTGDLTFCEGQSVQLTASTGNSYLWNSGQTSHAITVTAGGDYYVTVTNTQNCSSVSETVTVTVLPVPLNTVSVNGNTTFCQGESATLTADDGSSWLWTTTETIQSVVVNQTGNYYATITGSNGCSVESQHINITVYPKPDSVITVIGDLTFCEGQSVQLTASTGNSYLWNSGQTTHTITVTTGGDYYVTVTNTQNCSSVSETVTVVVNTSPAEPAITQNGDTLFAPAGYSSYAWILNSVVVQSGAQDYYLPTVSGNYYVEVTGANGCSTISQSYYYQNISVQADEFENMYTLHPNPFSQYTELGITGTNVNDVTIEFFDIAGKSVNIKTEKHNGKITIYRGTLQPGIYTYRLLKDNSVLVTGKMIIIE